MCVCMVPKNCCLFYFETIPALSSVPPPTVHLCGQVLKGHSSIVLTLAGADMRLYSGSSDRTVRVWDLTNISHHLSGLRSGTSRVGLASGTAMATA